MVIPQPAHSVSLPAIDTAGARWAAEELDVLIARVGSDSIAGLVLRHAQRELQSLIPEANPADVVGPFRLRIAA